MLCTYTLRERLTKAVLFLAADTGVIRQNEI